MLVRADGARITHRTCVRSWMLSATPHVHEVVLKSSSQVGKTEVILNVLGYNIDYNPAPILVLQPTVEMGQTFSKDRLAPMIRDTVVLRKKMDAKSRFSGNTIMQKTFPGGHVTIVGANSPAGLASPSHQNRSGR